MMEGTRWRRLRDVYERALDLSPQQRAAFLDDSCAGDLDLRSDIEAMLAHEEAGESFLEPPAKKILSQPGEGTRVGSFRLGRPVASGGMGTVYEAWQQDPQRKVAVKLVRRGMDGEAAQRRFRFEAQILARLRHPGIAQVYEAGVHRPDGGEEVPFFAMEFVEGARDVLTSANDDRLDLRARVELFLEVCDAVQHGHQQGVVHRDLKAANLLVDGEGRVKVIDFGIARALGERSPGQTEAPLTQAGQILGSLHTMSPEQFRGEPDAVDTRSDVYSLGMVLYELVCGRPPFDFDAPVIEVARRICEDAPLPARRANPDVPEDLGWILTKTLEKEPEARYAAASELAADLRRFLAHEPVVAGPPSNTYRLRKFVRRHRSGVAFASIAVLALIAGAAAAFLGLLEARRSQQALELERNIARGEAAKFRGINRVFEDMLTSVRTDRDGRDVRVADVLDRSAGELGEALAGQPEVEAPLRTAIGSSYGNLGLHAEAQRELEAAVSLWDGQPEPDTEGRLHAIASLAGVLLERHALDEAEHWIDEGRAASRRALGRAHPVTLRFQIVRASLLTKRGEHERAEHELREALQEVRPELGADDPSVLSLQHELAWSVLRQDRDEEAMSLFAELADTWERLEPGSPQALRSRFRYIEPLARVRGRWDEVRRELQPMLPRMIEVFGEEHPDTLRALCLQAEAHNAARESEVAYAILREVLPILERVHGPEHPATLRAREGMAVSLDRLGERAAGELVRRAAWETSRRLFGPDDDRTLENELSVGVLLVQQGKVEEALPLVERVLAMRLERLGLDDLSTLAALDAKANISSTLGDVATAEQEIRTVVEGRTQLLGPEHGETLRAQNLHINLLASLGRLDEALEQSARLLESHRRVLADDSPVWIRLYGNAGNIARDAQKLATAEDYLAIAWERVDRDLPESHPYRAFAAWDLGTVIALRGRHADSLVLLEEALDVFQLRPMEEPFQYGRCFLDVSACRTKVGRTAEAEESLSKAIDLLERAGEPARPYLERARVELEALRAGN